MPKRARIHFASLRSSLVNLPISIYGPLLERNVRPQHLAVHLSLQNDSTRERQPPTKVEVYVGWTGMASASSLAHFNAGQPSESSETVEIDPQYASSLGLSQGDMVEIGLLHDLPHAKMVGTEPVTSDDWDIIELHAEHVESTLLSQVRVAKLGQEIDVWVLGRTRVRLRITNLDPPVKGNTLLLTTNTEVSIAPKLHRTKDTPKPKTQPDAQGPPVNSKSPSSANPPSPSPATTVPHILRSVPSRALTSLHPPRHDGSELVAFVSPTTWMKLQKVPTDLHEPEGRLFKANFKRVTPPVDPSATQTSTTPAPSDPVPRILNATSQNETNEKTGAVDPSEVYIGVLEGLPSNHIVFPVRPDGIDEWDLVRISCLNPEDPISLSNTLPDEVQAAPTEPSSFLAGVDDILNACTQFCTEQFLLHSMTNSIHGCPGLLVTGRTGTGKTSIVRAVAQAMRENIHTLTYTHYVDASKLSETPIHTVKAHMNYWFDKCAWHRPSVLVIDNLDKLLGAEVEHADSFRSRHLTEIFLSIFSSSARTTPLNSRGIVFIATADSTSSLHPFINSAHVFKEIVHVTPPNKSARQEILSRLVQGRLEFAKTVTQDPENPINYAELATQTEGYSATDLKDLVGRALHQMAIRAAETRADTSQLFQADFTAAQADFVPLSLRAVKLEKSETSWSDIGGLWETRRVLRETLEWPTKYGPIFKQSPLRLRSGLLLYGFPGCGKTLLASAVAKECGLNFISVKGPEILNKYIGASEKSVRDLFERASAAKPCVLFFDEFDAIAPKRGHDSTGVTDRVVNQMLTQMDGAEGLDGVYVLAATSRPDLIDSALLRPGRLDKSLLCNMPDHAERKDILQAVARKMAVAPTVDFEDLASKTDGYSGADLQALMYNAHLEVIHASIADTATTTSSTSAETDEQPIQYFSLGAKPGKVFLSKAEEAAMQKRLRRIHQSSDRQSSVTKTATQAEPRNQHFITPEYIERALKATRPSVSLEERRRLDNIYRDFVSDRSGGLPVPPEAGGIGHRVTLG